MRNNDEYGWEAEVINGEILLTVWENYTYLTKEDLEKMLQAVEQDLA